MNSKSKSSIFQSFSQWVGMGQSLINDLDRQHGLDAATCNIVKELKNSMNSIQSCRDRIIGSHDPDIDNDDIDSTTSSESDSTSTTSTSTLTSTLTNDAQNPVQIVFNPWIVRKFVYNHQQN